jgi:anti-sigma regulatory factor (Ser/Thr protein kinase)
MTSPDPPVNAPGRATGPEVVVVDQPFTAGDLYSLRAAVVAHASSLGAPPVQAERLLIVASELATNAIRHGGGSGRLRLWRHHTRLHLEVSDHGPGLADPTVGSKPPGPMATGGRGMWICRQLADDLHIINGPAGTTITATLDRGRPHLHPDNRDATT